MTPAPFDDSGEPESPWLAKLRRVAAAEQEAAALAPSILDERLAALSSLPGTKVKPSKVKPQKVKAPKAEKVKAPKIKPEKTKRQPVEASRVEAPAREMPDVQRAAPTPVQAIPPVQRMPPAQAVPPAQTMPPVPTMPAAQPIPAAQPMSSAQAMSAVHAAPSTPVAPPPYISTPTPVESPVAVELPATKPEKVKPEKGKAEKVKPQKVKKEKVAAPKVAPPPPPPPFTPDPNAELVFVHTVRFGFRTIPLELWSDRISIGKRNVPWDQVRAVNARAGRVDIETADKKTSLSFVPAVEGVAEPVLAPLFAEIVLDGSAGAPPREKLARALADGKADTKYRFRERDDSSIPLLVMLITGLAGVLLAVLVPTVVTIPFRGGTTIGADTFLVYPRLSSLDPRSLVAAITGGMILSRLAMRAAAGRDLMLWARGTAAGWNRAQKLRGRLAKIAASRMLLHTREYAIALAVALILFLPTARERVLVDGDGVHVRAALPFFDRDVPWSNVAKPALIEQGGGSYDVVLTTTDAWIVGGTILDTRGALFYGLSPYELAQFSERKRNSTP